MKRIQGKIVNVYVLIMLAVFPLFMVNTYYNIQQAKMYLFMYSTIACLALVLLTAAVCAGRDRQERETLLREFSPAGIRSRLRPSGVLTVALLCITLISTFCSEWLYEAFWGSAGRNQGCFMWLFYIAAIFLVSRHYTCRPFHMDLFILTGVTVCGWCVLDFFSLSPIGVDYHTNFSSTFGNINMLSAGVAIFAAAVSVMFAGGSMESRTDRIRSICYLAAAAVIYMGLICARTANALLSAVFILCFIPFFAFRSKSGVLRYIALAAVFMACMAAVGLLCAWFPDYACEPDYRGELGKMAVKLTGVCLAAAFALAVLLAALWAFFRSRAAKQPPEERDSFGLTPSDRRLSRVLRIVWGVLGVLAAAVLIGILYDANTGGHPDFYAPISGVLIFDENWGTSRGYVWRMALRYFRDFTPFKKLVGSGPETFPVYVLIYDVKSNIRRFDYYYDSIHNELLQQLFETGILGFLSFYGLSIACSAEGILGALRSAVSSQGTATKVSDKSSSHGAASKANDKSSLQGTAAKANDKSSSQGAAAKANDKSGGSKKNKKNAGSGAADNKAAGCDPAFALTSAAAFSYAAAAYIVQSVVNVRVPIVFPLAIVCMAAAASFGRKGDVRA